MLWKKSWLLIFTGLLHLGWAVMTLVDERTGQTAHLNLMANAMPSWVISLSLFLATGCMALGMIQRDRWPRLAPMFLFPQQFLLFLTLGSRVNVALSGTYPDGTAASPIQHWAGAWPMIALGLVHLLVVLDWNGVRMPRRRPPSFGGFENGS